MFSLDPVVSPPSTTRVCPLTNPASSLASHKAACAMSSATPIRPRSGVRVWNASRASSIASGSPTMFAAFIGVRILPGAIAFTRIDQAPSSAATFFVNATTAPFAAP